LRRRPPGSPWLQIRRTMPLPCGEMTRQGGGTSSPLQHCPLCTSSPSTGDPMQLHAVSTSAPPCCMPTRWRAPGRPCHRHLTPRHGIREPRRHLVGRAAPPPSQVRPAPPPRYVSQLGARPHSLWSCALARRSLGLYCALPPARTSSHRKAFRRQPTTATSRRGP
jgi:hypothetical protein